MSEYLQNFMTDHVRIFTEFLCWIMLEYKNNLPSLVDKQRQILNIKKNILKASRYF